MNNEIRQHVGLIMHRQEGFTLVELIVSMAIFIVVMIGVSQTFEQILNRTTQSSRSEESQIAGIVGLEMLRYDVESAGMGLPWNMSGASYDEADIASGWLVAGIDPKTFNDAPTGVPKAVQVGTAADGSAYLVVKSSSVGMNSTARKWSYIRPNFGNYSVASWNNGDPVKADERVTVISAGYPSKTDPGSKDDRVLQVSGGKFYFDTPLSIPRPDRVGVGYFLYGINSKTDNASGSGLRMPFNRADYFVKRPSDPMDMPAYCANGTGNLYKVTINHSNGGASYYPLLDCVLDMQVGFNLDTNGDGASDLHSSTLPTGSPLVDDATAIRQQLKEVIIYLLVQEGRKDVKYSFPTQTVNVGETVNGITLGRTVDLQAKVGSDWMNYRWKVHKMVIKLKNIYPVPAAN